MKVKKVRGTGTGSVVGIRSKSRLSFWTDFSMFDWEVVLLLNTRCSFSALLWAGGSGVTGETHETLAALFRDKCHT